MRQKNKRGRHRLALVMHGKALMLKKVLTQEGPAEIGMDRVERESDETSRMGKRLQPSRCAKESGSGG